MSSSYKLSFVPQALQLQAKAKFHRNNDSSKLYIFQDDKLKSCEYVDGNWKETLLLNDIHVRTLYFADLLGDGQLMPIIKTERGIRFYQQNGTEFSILLKTDDFEDDNYFDDQYYDWDKPGSVIKMGRIYSDPNMVGIVGRRSDYGLQIFGIMKERLQSGEHPIMTFDANVDIFGNVTGATIALSDLKMNGQENIVVLGKFGLNVYQINRRTPITCCKYRKIG